MVNCNISYLGAVFLQYRSTPFLQYNTASHLTFTSILWLLNISWKLMNSFEKINHCWTFLNDNNFIVCLQPLSNHCCMHQWHYQRFAYQSLSGHLLEIFEGSSLPYLMLLLIESGAITISWDHLQCKFYQSVNYLRHLKDSRCVFRLA